MHSDDHFDCMKRFLIGLLLSIPFLTIQAQYLEGVAASKVVYGAEAVRISERTGHVQYIRFGERGPQSLPVLLEKRKPWMPAYNGPVSLDLIRSTDDGIGMTHDRYAVTLGGVPIEGSVVVGHSRGGRLASVNGDIYRVKAMGAATLSEEQALALALADVGADEYVWETGGMGRRFDQAHLSALAQPTLAYAPRNGEFRDDNFVLAWKLDIYATRPLSRQWIYVDAHTGEVVYRQNRIHTVDVVGSAVTMYSGTMPLTTDQTGPNAFRLRETGRGGGISTFNCQTGTDYLTAVDFTDADNAWNNVNPQQDQCATDAHIGAEATYDYFSIVHGWDSYDDNNAPLLSYVHYDVGFDNAFWDGTRMTYGDGSGGFFSSPLTTMDVCGHEITHGVTEFSAALIYNFDESGALNESFSDIFGNVLEHRVKPTDWSWLVGEECTPGAIGIRSMEDPTIFQNPGCYGDQWWMPSADPHYNSGVQNHWFYILTVGDTGTNALGNAYSVPAIGWTKSEAIAFRNLSVYLTPNSDYADARFYAIQSASDLYGACSPEMISTANAWYAVGVGGPWTNVPLSAFQAMPRNFCDAPATVNFVNNSNSGASYLWDFGDGGTSTLANPTHVYNALGSYTVTLVTTSCTGLRDTLVMPNYVVLDTNIACAVTLPVTGTTTINYCIGTVLDPGGYNDYPDNANTVVTIQPPVADYIVLTFNAFQLEDFFDYLNVYDGPTTASTLIGSYTGSVGPPGGTLTSSTGVVTLEFTSDPSVTMPGFDIGFECFMATTAPTANFSALPLTTCDGNVSFSDLSVDHPNSWSWNFGDGSPLSTLQNPTHQYAAPGTYTVSLTACNGIGCDTYTCTNCVIYDPNAPACQISTLPTSGLVTLTACSGSVADDGGATNPYTDNVDVYAVISPPGATQVSIYFTQFMIEDFFDSLVVFDGTSISSPRLGAYSGFNLPNGGQPLVSTGGAIMLHFTTDLSVVYDGFQATWTSVGATNGPSAAFNAPVSASSGVPVNFTDASTGATAWAWDFGDGGTSPLQNPTHTYAASGTYPVSLVVNNAGGCQDVHVQNIYVDVVAVDPGRATTFSLFPNPAGDRVQLDLRLPDASAVRLRVTNAMGQQVYAQDFAATAQLQRVLETSALARGMYFVQVETTHGSLVRKLVLE